MTDRSTDEMMDAVYAALCTHGYAALTMQDIADEWGKSKSALHYHYDSKHELLVTFLDYLLDDVEAELSTLADRPPADRLTGLVDLLLSDDGETKREFRTALLEIKAQAPYCEGYRARLCRFDELLREEVTAAVREGQSTGAVRESVDPDAVATMVVTVAMGAQTRSVSVEAPVVDARELLLAYLDDVVFVAREVATE